jgi:signal transduction histidine kinase
MSALAPESRPRVPSKAYDSTALPLTNAPHGPAILSGAAPNPYPSVGDPARPRRVEHVIAVARLLISLGVVEAVRFSPTQDLPHSGLTSVVLVAYGGIVLLYQLTFHRETVPRQLPIAMQTGDIVLAVVFASFHGWNGPGLTLLLFPLLAAGYRWGFLESMITVAALELLLAVQAVALNSGAASSLQAFHLNVFASTAMIIVSAGAVIGYLAENEHRRRWESSAMCSIAAQAHPDARFRRALGMVLASLRDVFGATGALLLVRETGTGRLFRWTTEAAPDEALPAVELSAAERDNYLFATAGAAWHGVARKLWHRGRFHTVAVDSLGRRVPSTELVIPAGFLAAHRCRRLVCVDLTFSDEWSGRLFIMEPVVGIHRDQNARFALQLAGEAGRVLYRHYLVHGVRMRAKAVERGRIARELHDGITQSLLGLEMQIAVVRRRAIAEAPQLDEDLARIHRVLRQEVITLRELMEGIRSGGSTSQDITEELGEMVAKFQRHTGIAATFQSDNTLAIASEHTRRQIALILHEALVNVRKHSSAHRVTVRATATKDRLQLSIEDDGRGFRFAGVRSHSELDALNQGPRTIGERVRMIGGEMSVESRPGMGVRVDVAIPLQLTGA